MTIRKALAKNSAGLQQCMERAYSVYFDRLDGRSLPPMEIDYSEEIEKYPTGVVDCDDVRVYMKKRVM